MLESAGQPVKDPQEFAQTYAGVVNNIIEQHRKQRIPNSFQQIADGATGMEITDNSRVQNYNG